MLRNETMLRWSSVICLCVLLLVGLSPPTTVRAQSASDEAVAEEPGDPLLEAALQPWTGDFDGMLARGMIRVGVPYGLTTYFIDGIHQRGPTYDRLLEFEKVLKKWLGSKAANLTLVVVPARRDRLIEMLVQGQIDVAAGTLTVTPERLARVDFSDPLTSDVREVLVTGPAAPEVTKAADMLASEVHVRRSSSFFEHLAALNVRRQAEGKPPFAVVEADENLNSEDLLEMVEAGLIPATIADEPVVQALQPIFPDLRIHDDIALAENGSYAWAFRKGSPKLAEQVNDFIKISKKGTKLGNILLNRYTKNSEWLQNALAPADSTRFQEHGRVPATLRRQVRLRLADDRGTRLSGIPPRPEQAEPCRRDRRHAGDAADGQGPERCGREHPPTRTEHPCRREVFAFFARPLLQRAGAQPSRPDPVHLRGLQRRPRQRHQSEEACGKDGARPKCVARQRGDRGRQGDQPRAGRLCPQHLPLPRRLQALGEE